MLKSGVREHPRAAFGRRAWIVLVVLVVIGLWLILGFARGPELATASFTAFEAHQVDQVQATALPAIPPFFLAQVQGEIYLGDRMWSAASRFYLVEPVTGWTLDLSAMGLAPSASLSGAASNVDRAFTAWKGAPTVRQSR